MTSFHPSLNTFVGETQGEKIEPAVSQIATSGRASSPNVFKITEVPAMVLGESVQNKLQE
jgi:hypothetical protein